MKKQGSLFFLALLFTVLLMTLAFWRVDWSNVFEAFQSAQWFPWLPLSIASYLFGHLLRGLRLKLLVYSETKLPLITSSNIVVVGYAVNNILPARLGEFVRAKLFADITGLSYVRSVAITFLERLLDGLAILCLFAVAAQFIVISGWMNEVAKVAASILGIALAVIVAVIFCPRYLESKVSAISARFGPKFQAWSVSLVAQACYGFASFKSPAHAAIVFFLSIVIWLIETLFYSLTLKCFAVQCNFAQIVVVMAVTNLGLLIPSAPGFIGAFHYFCMQSLLSFNVPRAVALSSAIVIHLSFYIPVTIWGGLVLGFYGIAGRRKKLVLPSN